MRRLLEIAPEEGIFIAMAIALAHRPAGWSGAVAESHDLCNSRFTRAER